MINLQTYMGGRDLWGLHDHHMPEEQVKNFKKPIFDDGLLEVPQLPKHTCLMGCTFALWPHKGALPFVNAEVCLPIHERMEVLCPFTC